MDLEFELLLDRTQYEQNILVLSCTLCVVLKGFGKNRQNFDANRIRITRRYHPQIMNN